MTERTYHCGDVSDRTTTMEMSVKNLPLTSASQTSSVTERIDHCRDVSEELTIVEMSVKNLPLWRCQWLPSTWPPTLHSSAPLQDLRYEVASPCLTAPAHPTHHNRGSTLSSKTLSSFLFFFFLQRNIF